MPHILPDVIISVTSHAIERWQQRFPAEKCHVDTILDCIRRGKLLKKDAFLPVARTPGSVYVHTEDIKAFFILKNAGLKKLELLTMYEWGGGKLDTPITQTFTKDSLVQEKLLLESSLSAMHKSDPKRSEITFRVAEINTLLSEYKNKPAPADPVTAALVERQAANILIELREIKRLLADFTKLATAILSKPNEDTAKLRIRS